ncbi:hypothetical protein ACFYVL_31555 [Streptomyces sp. NPDC004111]|uniref:hypothetical protein n=1 Tax=Streptomyces sp. NPDC004111 TaxID=3364690 RepID=UPI00367FDD8C
MDPALPQEPIETAGTTRPADTADLPSTERDGDWPPRQDPPKPHSTNGPAPAPAPLGRLPGQPAEPGAAGGAQTITRALAPEDPAVREARRALQGAVADLRQQALFNFGEMNAVKLTAVLGQLLEHSELPRPYLETVRAVFAEPEGYRTAYARLRQPGAVLVLLREPGAGRTFAAHALLADLHVNTGARVGPLSFGGSARFPLGRLPTEQNAGYLLELPTDEDDTLAVADDFGALLPNIQQALARYSSRLIVLTTPEQWQRIRGGAPHDAVPHLGRPDPVAMARAWLNAEAPDLDTGSWLADARIQELLYGQAPSDVLSVVALILKADRSRTHSRVQSATDEQGTRTTEADAFNASVQSVVHARTAWRRELLAWHSTPGRTHFERNFLLVAALLRNASAAHIYVKTAELCREFATQVSLHGQEAPGVLELVDKIEADLDPTDDTLSFSRPGWDDAILSYFWVDRPAARKTFLSWMAEAPTAAKPNDFLESFSPEERLLLANRVGAFAVRWAARHRKPDPLERIICAWQRDEDLWKAAIELVSAATFHPRFGRFVHELLLRWSKNKEEAALPRLTVDVCAGEFGRRHTAKAMVRLQHAAASDDPAVQKSLHAAVRTIWADSTAREGLFKAVSAWCAPSSPRRVSGRRSFAALATLTAARGQSEPAVPVLLQRSDEDDYLPPPQDLATGWSALLSAAEDDPEPLAALALWMDTAHQRQELRPLVFGALRGALTAADSDLARALRNRLTDLLYAWQPFPATEADPQRVRLRHELTDLLFHDRRQAVAPYHPRAARTAETR